MDLEPQAQSISKEPPSKVAAGAVAQFETYPADRNLTGFAPPRAGALVPLELRRYTLTEAERNKFLTDLATLVVELESAQGVLYTKRRAYLNRLKKDEKRNRLLPDIYASIPIGDSYVCLPEIGGVEVPLYSSGSKKMVVSVGSRAWLRVMDQMRAVGTDLNTLRQFKRNSMLRIERDALIWFRDRNFVQNEYLGLYQGPALIGGVIPAGLLNASNVAGVNSPIKTPAEYEIAYWDGIQFVEYFCMAYPDKQKADIRYSQNLRKLYDYIRKKAGEQGINNPFLPQKLAVGETQLPGYEGKPLKLDLAVEFPSVAASVGTATEYQTIPDILRYWRKIGKKKHVFLDDTGDIVAQNELEPDDLNSTSWIPLDQNGYRDSVETAFNLSKYKYLHADSFRNTMFRFMLHLLSIGEYDEVFTGPFGRDTREFFGIDERTLGGVIAQDESGYAYLATTAADGVGYIIYHHPMKLSMNTYDPNEVTTQNNDISLRDFLWQNRRKIFPSHSTEFMFDGGSGERKAYPLLHVILNVKPLPGTDPQYLYSNLVDRDGSKPERMFSDAPFRWFQQALLAQYGGDPSSGKPLKDCFQMFKRNFWADVSSENNRVDGKEMIDPSVIPQEMTSFIRAIFDFGGNTSCYLGVTQPKTGDAWGDIGANIPTPDPVEYLKNKAAFPASATFHDMAQAPKGQLIRQYSYLLEKTSKRRR